MTESVRHIKADQQLITEIASAITQDDGFKPSQDQKDRLSQLGWKHHCGFGAGRIAFKKGDVIVKIARENRDTKLNEQEVSVWEQHAAEDNMLFAPVRNHGPDFCWIAMPYCKPGGNESDYETKLAESHWENVEIDFSNIGIHTANNEEHLVSFDYHTAQRQKENVS